MINFFTEEIDFSLENEVEISTWIKEQSGLYGVDIQIINYVFCSDEYLLNINNEHLDHDYYTDIITFDMRDAKGQPIEADVFVSIDRIRDNAQKEGVSFLNELHRVLIHGFLHLVGYGDKTDQEAVQMRTQEEKCLSLLSL